MFFKNHAFKRVGRTNQRISTSEIRKLAQEERKRLSFDEQICEEASLEEIDKEKVKWYREKREEIGKVKKPKEMDLETLLVRAIREGIINALIHRDYTEPADTRVLIFDDRIEILNPGKFPEGTSPEDPKHIPVNPVLCQLIYDVGFIEKYELSKRETKLVFHSGKETVLISEIVKLGIELNKRQREGLEAILKTGKITNADYSKMFKVSRNTATNDLAELMEKGLIERVGKGRGSYYIPKI